MDAANAKCQVSALLDFYGSFLTEKQYQITHLYYNEDLSLSEIADIQNISRQAVWEHIKKSEAYLYSLESKLALQQKFLNLQSGLDNIIEICLSIEGLIPASVKFQVNSIKNIANNLKKL